MVEMHKAKAGEKDSQPALELYHWLLQVASQLFEDDGSLCLYMPNNPLLAKCKTFFETIGAGRETREKVLHDGLVPVFWKTVQHERVVHLHERFDGAILGDGDGET